MLASSPNPLCPSGNCPTCRRFLSTVSLVLIPSVSCAEDQIGLMIDRMTDDSRPLKCEDSCGEPIVVHHRTMRSLRSLRSNAFESNSRSLKPPCRPIQSALGAWQTRYLTDRQSSRHSSRCSSLLDESVSLAELQAQMADALKSEDYGLAAKLRDAIGCVAWGQTGHCLEPHLLMQSSGLHM